MFFHLCTITTSLLRINYPDGFLLLAEITASRVQQSLKESFMKWNAKQLKTCICVWLVTVLRPNVRALENKSTVRHPQ